MTERASDRSRVLVVDDDAMNRGLIRAWLEPAREVIEARDGAGAVAAIEAGGVDLVLLDLVMPGMDGVETCRAIRRAAPAAPFLPVLLVSSRSSAADRIAGLAAGADDFVTMPCDREELTLRVDAFLRTRRQDAIIRAQLAELTRVSALKEDLIALVAHDLRGPLASVLSLLSIAAEDVPDPEIRKDLEVARAAADRAREIAEDLLQVRLLEHGEQPPVRVPVAVADLVRDAVRLLEPLARERGISIRVAAEGTPVIPLDGRLVRRAVENLVASALRHSPRGAPVDVRIRRAGGGIEIDVVDRGPAVPDAARGEVFRTFAPAGRAAGGRRVYGLGLFLVRLVAEAHGGGAAVLAGEDGGTTFRILLPEVAGA